MANLRPVSTRQAAIRRERRRMADAYPVRPLCDVPWCHAPADDLHEALSRARGGSPTDEANTHPLCRPCHDLISAEPLWAYGLGLLRHSHPADPEVFRDVTVGKTGRLYPRLSPAERLWRGLDASRGPDACWPCRGNLRGRKGYGLLRGSGWEEGTHRVAYRVAYGPIPAGLQVQHECDNPPCCNPGHLIVGTNTQNMAAMVARGRARVYGKDQKLTTEQAAVIRDRYAEGGWTQRELAVTYGVSQGRIWQIVGRPVTSQELRLG